MTMEKADKSAFLTPSIRKHYALYVIRKALLRAIKEAAPELKGTLIDVGCGIQPYKELLLENSGIDTYIGVEWENSHYLQRVKPDKCWDGKTLPFDDDSADCCMATELFEHLASPEQVAADIFRVLKQDGTLFLTVPFLWPLHEIPNDEYRYTPFSIRRILVAAGFREENILIKATGGWYACLAQMIAHTLTEETSHGLTRKFLIRSSIPLIRWLVKNDRRPETFDKLHTMFLGLSIVAKKSGPAPGSFTAKKTDK